MHLLFHDNASSNINYFLFTLAYVKCGLYEVNKNNRANATHGPSLVRKLF